jgi:uncharacterized membrane protein YeaQ/YmgE (transglycosylase-associated protein family)
MSVLGWILFRLIVGIGKLVMPGKDSGGFLATVAIGMIRAVIGGILERLVGMYGQNDPVGFIMVVVLAIVFLWLYRVLARRTAVS